MLLKNVLLRNNVYQKSYIKTQLLAKYKFCTKNNESPKEPISNNEPIPTEEPITQESAVPPFHDSEIESMVAAKEQAKREEKARNEYKKKTRMYLILGALGLLTTTAMMFILTGTMKTRVDDVWTPEEVFAEKLNEVEICDRLVFLSACIDVHTVRQYVFEQGWPLKMAIDSLRHRDRKVRDHALILLTKMSDYPEFKEVIATKRINYRQIMKEAVQSNSLGNNEITEEAKQILLLQEIPKYAFLSQFLEKTHVQEAAIKTGYYYLLEEMLLKLDDDYSAQDIAVISLAKLASDPTANKLMASRQLVFTKAMELTEPLNYALANNGSALRMKAIESLPILIEQIFNGPNKNFILGLISPKQLEIFPQYIENLKTTSTEAYLNGSFVGPHMAVVGFTSIIWGFLRHLIKNRKQNIASKMKVKNAIVKGGGGSFLVATVAFALIQVFSILSERYVTENPKQEVEVIQRVGLATCFFTTFFISRQLGVFGFFPAATRSFETIRTPFTPFAQLESIRLSTSQFELFGLPSQEDRQRALKENKQ